MRPQPIYTEDNLKKQVFLKPLHPINCGAFLKLVLAKTKQVAQYPWWGQFAKFGNASTNNLHCKSLEGTWYWNWKYLNAE